MSSNSSDKWSSGFGFIMSAAGSAVGLGNIWKFPYVCGTKGGALFLIAYILISLIMGVPILLTELAVGRNGQGNAVKSCEKIRKGWGFCGLFGVAGALLVLSFYSVVGGWVIKYAVNFIGGSIPEAGYFAEYTAKTTEPYLWQLLFLLICTLTVAFGISGGIEQVSKVLMPLLLIMLTGIMFYTLTMPGAADGVRFFLSPAESGGDLKEVFIAALGQVFFSLSLGMGTLITYGSYLGREVSLTKSAFLIVGIDTLIAVICGLTVLPAVYAAGLSPREGPGLIFSSMTAVFDRMKYGTVYGALFFLLMLFAAVTSAISLSEVVTAYTLDALKISRTAASVITGAAAAILGIPAHLSFGVLSEKKIMGRSVFELYGFLSDNVLMPLGGLSLCILAGYIWGKKGLCGEISAAGKDHPKAAGLYTALIKYICPVFIVLVFVSSVIF